VKAIVFIITSLFSFTLMAQSVVPLSEGDPAPFDGILLSKEAAADVMMLKQSTKLVRQYQNVSFIKE